MANSIQTSPTPKKALISGTTGNDTLNGFDRMARMSILENKPNQVNEINNAVGFAAIKNDGSVVTWGFGGIINGIVSNISNGGGAVEVFSNSKAFVALKNNGTVRNWGEFYDGTTTANPTIPIAENLTSGVKEIFSTTGAFAALKEDGSVVTWGYDYLGGDSRAASSKLDRDVVSIFSNKTDFVALKKDGSLVYWGNSEQEFNIVAKNLLGGVSRVFSTNTAFAALKNDGSVVTWGQYSSGVDNGDILNILSSGVIEIYSNGHAFAALKNDGSVVTWGVDIFGGNSSVNVTNNRGGWAVRSVADKLSSGVKEIYSTEGAFAALKEDGSVVTWGYSFDGGPSRGVTDGADSSAVIDKISSGVIKIFSNERAFAALKEDGSVVSWGDSRFGGDSSDVSDFLVSGVVNITSTGGGNYHDSSQAGAMEGGAFAALKKDGSVVTWGKTGFGGDSSAVSNKLRKGVVEIFSTARAFAALKEDGSVITWGDSGLGGDSSSVEDFLKGGVITLANPLKKVRINFDQLTMQGGMGDDHYFIDRVDDLVIEMPAQGKDTILTPFSRILEVNVENLVLTGSGKTNGTGNAMDNVITGNLAANVLIGGIGIDSLVGGTGNDTYVVDDAGDLVVENAGEGTDEVQSYVNLTLSVNADNLVLLGEAPLNGTGNALANAITGNEAANLLDGGAGIDSLVGGAGDDTYIVDVVDDVAVEALNEGMDLVVAGVNGYILGDNFENLLLAGSISSGTGNALANTLTGNGVGNSLDGGAGIDTLFGGGGNDTYFVDNVADMVIETLNQGRDLVVVTANGYTLGENVENLLLAESIQLGSGNALANTLTGNAAANSLNGGQGVDTLVGGAGSDTYFVDDVADIAVEVSNGGIDLVVATTNGYTLGGNVENLLLTGSISSGTGNALANTLTGNGAGNSLNGGAGIDTLVGGAGSDTLIVDENADRVVEFASGGYDIVQSTANNFTLSEYVEDLQLLGNGAISGRGNSLANILTGNTAANSLGGITGNDTLIGGGGNDTLGVGAGLASVVGGTGNDLLQIDWSSIAGGMLTRSIQKVGTGADVTYRGSYVAKDTTGKVLAQVNFDSIEQLSLGGMPINLAEASAPGVVANRFSTTAKTSETGDKVDFSVALNVAPKGNVTLRFQSSDLTEGRVLNPELTFTPTNWDTPQRLSVQGVDDFDSDGNIGYTVTGQVVTTDQTYNLVSAPSFNLINNDDGQDNDREIYGTIKMDSLEGANGKDRIYGGGGRDQLKGGRGNDRLYGQEDNDSLFGELGNDEIYGGYDDDLLDGGEGGDSLFGEQSRDTLIGGAGNDYLDGGLLSDSMSGGAGNDTYFVDSSGDVINDLGATTDVDTVLVLATVNYTLAANIENASINSAAGNASLNGNALDNGLVGNDGNNLLDGGVGNDNLNGSGGVDSLAGGIGNDSMDGGVGNDSLLGGLGNDAFIGGVGNDSLVGGDGIDQADYSAASVAIQVNLLSGAASGDGADSLSGIENVTTGSANDALVGNSVDNNLSSGLGNDSLDGGAGNDIVDGGVGNDSLLGGLGNDSLLGGLGNDAFIGGVGNDSLVGGDGIDRADYSALSVAMQVNLLSGAASGDGADSLSGIENVTTGSANDALVGNSVDNNLSSGLGNDSLDGGAGNDIVDAGAGNDSLLGSFGNDTLSGCFFGANGGRSEIDTLVGGVGNDIFQLGWSSGRFYDDGNTKNAGRTDYVLITDFTVGQDKLQLDGAAAGYYLAASGVTGVTGTGLFHDSNANAKLDATDELIAIIRNASGTALDKANTVNTAVFV